MFFAYMGNFAYMHARMPTRSAPEAFRGAWMVCDSLRHDCPCTSLPPSTTAAMVVAVSLMLRPLQQRAHEPSPSPPPSDPAPPHR